MEDINFKLEKGGASTSRAKHFNFVNPGLIPEDLTQVPGFIDDMVRWSMIRSPCPNRTLSFAGALAMLAHLSGRTYTDESGTRTNLYVIALSSTGSGKETPRAANSSLAKMLGVTESLMENVASGEALEDELVKLPSLLLQSDEIAMLFGQMRGQGRLSRALSARLRTLYTSSGNDYIPRKKANSCAAAKKIENPHLTIFGTGVPEELLDDLTPQEIRNGLFGRCIILAARDENVRRPSVAFEKPSRDLMEMARYLAKLEYGRRGKAPELFIALEDDSVKEARKQVMAFFGKQRRMLAESDMKNAHAIVARIDEKISKLALLYAISANPYSPRISVDAIEWAANFAAYVVKWMLYEVQFHVAEGRFGKLMEHAKAYISKQGGSAIRRDVFRALHCDEATFKRLIKALLLAEEIEPPALIDGNVTYSLVK